MKYKLVQMADGSFVQSEWTSMGDFLAGAEARGFNHVGWNNNRRQRAELQLKPTFSNLCGPMWDGDCIRYEDSGTNARMSA